jgi:hypothetical protein
MMTETKRYPDLTKSAEILVAMQFLNKSHVVDHHQDLFEIEKAKVSIKTKEETEKRLEEYQRSFF